MGGKFRRLTSALGFIALPLTACDDQGPEMGTVRVTLNQETRGAVAQLLSDGLMAGADLSTVSELQVKITGISLHPMGDTETEGEGASSGWVDLTLEEGTSAEFVNLLAAPGENALGTLLASELVPAGGFRMMRVQVEAAQVVFTEDVTIGGTTFLAGEAHALSIPSGAQSGIKFNLFMDVEGGETDIVQLVVDSFQTAASIHVTGNGKLVMSPVWKIKVVTEEQAEVTTP